MFATYLPEDPVAAVAGAAVAGVAAVDRAAVALGLPLVGALR